MRTRAEDGMRRVLRVDENRDKDQYEDEELPSNQGI